MAYKHQLGAPRASEKRVQTRILRIFMHLTFGHCNALLSDRKKDTL
jgi:hypothetical protein